MLTDSDSVLLVIVWVEKLLIEIQVKLRVSILEQHVHVFLFFCSDNEFSKKLI